MGADLGGLAPTKSSLQRRMGPNRLRGLNDDIVSEVPSGLGSSFDRWRRVGESWATNFRPNDQCPDNNDQARASKSTKLPAAIGVNSNEARFECRPI